MLRRATPFFEINGRCGSAIAWWVEEVGEDRFTVIYIAGDECFWRRGLRLWRAVAGAIKQPRWKAMAVGFIVLLK